MLGKILKDLRESAQEKQKDVANAVFVSPSAISQYESGRTTPSRNTLEALAKHFNVTTDYLLGSSPNPELEETMNRIFCDGTTVSALLDKCMQIPKDKRPLLLIMVDALRTTDSENNIR